MRASIIKTIESPLLLKRIKSPLMLERKAELVSYKEYSAEEAGLTKLLFDNEVLLIMYNQMKGRIKNIYLEQQSEVIENMTGNNSYEEIVFPTWNMNATVEGELEGRISGVIKPRIITRFDEEQTQYLAPEARSELFFYLVGKKVCIEGKSTKMYGAEGINFKGLECKTRDVDIKTVAGNIPDIKFTDSFTDSCLIYNGTRLEEGYKFNSRFIFL